MAAELGLAHHVLNGLAALETDHRLGQRLDLLLVDLVLRLDDVGIVLRSQDLAAKPEHDRLRLRRGIETLQGGYAVFQEFGKEHTRRFR